MKIRYQGEKSIVTFCESVQTGKGRDIELSEVLDRIRGDEFKDRIGGIRAAYRLERGRLKKSLPAIIPTGSLAGGRVAGNRMIPRSGVVVLDFDHLSGEEFYQGGVSAEAEDLKDLLKTDPSIVAVFISPSGDGVKALPRCDDFEADLSAMFDHYDRLTGYRPDEQGKNVNRHCFVSHDPDLFVNYSAKVFPVPPKKYSDQNQGSQFVENHSFDGVKSLDTLDKASPAPPPPPLSVSLCNQSSFYVTNGEEKSAVAPTRSSLDARKEFVKTRKDLLKFYVRWIERKYTPKQGCRNSDLIKMVTFLFHALSEDLTLLFARQFYRQNQHLWDGDDSLGTHMSEARSHLKTISKSYPDSLNPDESKFYKSASVPQQDSFRIGRDLASRENAKSEDSEPIFFLAQNELALRAGYESYRDGNKPSKLGGDLIAKLIKEGFLEIVRKGQQGNPRYGKLRATEYRWLGSLTDSSIYNKEENP